MSWEDALCCCYQLDPLGKRGSRWVSSSLLLQLPWPAGFRDLSQPRSTKRSGRLNRCTEERKKILWDDNNRAAESCKQDVLSTPPLPLIHRGRQVTVLWCLAVCHPWRNLACQRGRGVHWNYFSFSQGFPGQWLRTHKSVFWNKESNLEFLKRPGYLRRRNQHV